MQRPLFTLPLPTVLLNALVKSGYNSVEDLYENGACAKKVEDILTNYNFLWKDFENLLKPPIIRTAEQVLKAESTRLSILTFSESLDNAIGGGIQTESITEICGPPGSGKSQLVLQLCVNVQIPTCLGGLGGEAIFVDTDSGFSPARLNDISISVLDHCLKVAQVHNMTENISDFTTESILNHVHYLQAGDYIQLLAAVHRLKAFILKHPKVKLIVIDSIIFPFLTMTNILDRTRIISMIILELHSIAVHFNLAVVATNHISTQLTNGLKSLTPSLGESLSHIVPQIIFLGKLKNKFSATIHKSCELPDAIIHFMITKDGLRDFHDDI